MASLTDVKACTGCAKAKRRCDREQPACHRCRRRGAQCHYPPAKAANFVLLGTASGTTQDTGQQTSQQASQQTARQTAQQTAQQTIPEPMSAATFAALSSQNAILVSDTHPLCETVSGSSESEAAGDQSHHTAPSGMSGPSLATPTPQSSDSRGLAPTYWFLSPESWKIDHRSGTISTSYCSSVLMAYVDNIKRWLKTWVDTGECPFIHSRLYLTRFPDCIQIAYTTMASYIHKTETSTSIVLHVAQEQAHKLLLDNGVVLDDNGCWQVGASADSTCAPSILSQIARIHALTIYQMISLFDGDIRSRHLAERRLVVLGKWCSQILEHARQTFSPQFVESTDPRRYRIAEVVPIGGTDSIPGPNPDHPWYIWILTETIRRSWTVASGLETVYFMLQCGWFPCSGGLSFTTHQGVWDAKTAVAWERFCDDGALAPMQRFDCEKIFETHRPPDVDEFTKAIMQMTYGLERMERWHGDSRNSRPEPRTRQRRPTDPL